ncbi:hypothetical protein B0H19DRAFT_1386736 [Mycena capillaripes]|nr:hypothetical protein B0H19DRAFT_1386736 [Mycena capillaripes]
MTRPPSEGRRHAFTLAAFSLVTIYENAAVLELLRSSEEALPLCYLSLNAKPALKWNMPATLVCPRPTPFDAGAHVTYAASDTTKRVTGKESAADREGGGLCGVVAPTYRPMMRASAAYPKCTPSPWSTFCTNLTRLRMIPVHTLSIVAGPAAHMDSCVAAAQGVDGAGYGIRSRTSIVYPPAESLFPRGERASIPITKAHLRSAPFPPPAPSSPILCRLDSGVSCCRIALLSTFSLLVRPYVTPPCTAYKG